MQNKRVEDFGKHIVKINVLILNSVFKKFKKHFALNNKAYLEGSIPIKNNEIIRFEELMVLRNMDELL